MKLPILYCDDYIVVINKPSGLLVHRSSIDKFETQFAVQILRNQLGKKVYPIHRLDKPTSGVLVFAFSAEIIQQIATNWELVEKYYLALTRGRVLATTIDSPIKTITHSGREKIQQAQTTVIPQGVATLPIVFGKNTRDYTHTNFSLVLCKLHTGRQHQIRKHLKHIHHHLVGDTRYGRGEINRYFREHYNVHRLLLHCAMIQLEHPITSQKLCLYAPLDSVWSRLLSKLQWQECNGVAVSTFIDGSCK